MPRPSLKPEHAGTYINGGGLVGSFAGVDPLLPDAPYTATVGDVNANFISNRVVANANLSGGGLVGNWSWKGDVRIGDIRGTFKDNIVAANSSYMRGGGIIGLRTYTGESVLGTVSASFLNNRITVGTSLGGAGIIGLYSAETYQGDRDKDKTSTIAGIDGANFISNTVRVGSAGAQNVYVGLRLSRDFLVGKNGMVTPAIYAAWEHEFADDNLQTNARYAGYGTSFGISSGQLDRDAMELGAAVNARVMSVNDLELNLMGGYTMECNQDYQDRQFYVGLNVKF